MKKVKAINILSNIYRSVDRTLSVLVMPIEGPVWEDGNGSKQFKNQKLCPSYS